MHILPLSAQEIENRLKNLPENAVMHEYDATSQYPVSGIAVAQALASLYTHYVGTEIDAENINGATYITPNFKVNDIYINTEEKCMYQCVSSDALNDGSGAYNSVWRVVSPIVDQIFNENSENALSGRAVAEAIKTVAIDVDNTLSRANTAAEAKAVGNELSLINQRLNNLNYKSGLNSYEVDGTVILESLYIPIDVSCVDGHVKISM